MKVIKKYFTKQHLNDCDTVKLLCKAINCNPVNNINLILQKLKEYHNTNGAYVECGTYRGNTILPAAIYSKHFDVFQSQLLYGIDTFKGFPKTNNNEHDYRDHPMFFKTLYENKEIDQLHFTKAMHRTKKFTDTSHLENEYFLDTNLVFNTCNKFNNIKLLQGTFKEITPGFNENISILHLDGDLYYSYLTCLENLYDNVIMGGVVIFDEYYSHKYPGARVAVNEFFKSKPGHFEMYLTSEGHERWCFVKGSNNE